MAVKVESEKCSACKSCVDACPSQAIEVPDTVAVVKDGECIDCGACVDACPSSALVL